MRKSVELVRAPGLGLLIKDLGTEALKAMASIRGVSDCRIESENEDSVTISYAWQADGDRWGGDILATSHLKVAGS